MKKLLLFTLLFIGLIAKAQFGVPQTVYDPTASANMSTQIKQSIQQVSQLEKSYDLMKKADEAVKQVNGYVQQAGYLQNIIIKQKEAINNANEILKISRSMKGVSIAGVQQNLAMISGSVKNVQALLSNGIFNMNDSERLNRLDKEYQKVSESSTNIKTKLIQLSFR